MISPKHSQLRGAKTSWAHLWNSTREKDPNLGVVSNAKIQKETCSDRSRSIRRRRGYSKNIQILPHGKKSNQRGDNGNPFYYSNTRRRSHLLTRRLDYSGNCWR